jgi:hypothetical protein
MRPIVSELFYADGRTDITKLRVAIRNFAKAPQNDAEACSAKNKPPFSVKWRTDKVM